jgi:dienelactone hydrolase
MEKRVHFYSGPGLKLAGFLSVPADYDSGAGRLPGIVLCHGPGGYKNPEAVSRDTLMPAVSRWLNRAGFVTLRFSYRGVGESEGPDYRLIPLEQAEDIGNAITFIQQQAEVDANRIGLFGAATGGAHVSYVAGIDPRAKCIVSVSGMGDLGRWARSTRRYWEWVEFLKVLDKDRVDRVLTGKSRALDMTEIILPDPAAKREASGMSTEVRSTAMLMTLESGEAIVNYRPETVVDRISPRAAMWICAANDTLVPVDEARSLYQRAKEPKKLVVLTGMEHHALYHSPALDQVMVNATEWFATYLKEASTEAGPF